MIKNDEYNIEDDVVPLFFLFSMQIPQKREFLKKVNINADYVFTIASYGSDGDQNALKIMRKTFKIKVWI